MQKQEFLVGDLIERARERAADFGPQKIELLRASAKDLAEVAKGTCRGFILEPEDGANNFTDYIFIVDANDISAEAPQAPEGYVHLTGAPIDQPLALILLTRLNQESGV